LALNWLLRRPGVTAPIIGAASLPHLEENLGAVGWELTPEELAQLEEASSFEVGYPYDFIWRLHQDR